MIIIQGLPWIPRWLIGKESVCSTGGSGSIPGLKRSPGGGNGNPLLYSCLEIFVDRGSLGTTVHGVSKSWTHWALMHKGCPVIASSLQFGGLAIWKGPWDRVHSPGRVFGVWHSVALISSCDPCWPQEGLSPPQVHAVQGCWGWNKILHEDELSPAAPAYCRCYPNISIILCMI